jgi:hypothetical protein
MCNDYASVCDDGFAPCAVRYDLGRRILVHQCSQMPSGMDVHFDVTHDFERRRLFGSH